ncbi:AfsR/SARP family transcriptional regulator [Streptacidiphilus carbonis]|jgi:DNA-binding SARP family transcriptional activator|uniref:AfsR/SARP family transcriptional regulator n=1 Tax=Streptacidiphilus carbonis TaxID=105422 RepID=UPI0005A5D149|nr:BTAD domain-containing putative transcriptional regulator [Streptacidiphilus carbonis]
MIELSLLGGWRLTSDGQPVALPEAGRRVVAHVALHGPATRQILVGALWPEAPEAQAHACLRSTLWRIRRCPAPLLLVRGDRVMLDLARIRLDLAELNNLLLRPPDPPRPEPAYLTGGDLLPDWYDDWVLSEQEQLRQHCLHALDRLAAALLERGDCAGALEMALGAVAMEPLRESAHRAVIEVHLREGNASEALRHYEAYRKLLWSELGLEPSPLLRRLLPVRTSFGTALS